MVSSPLIELAASYGISVDSATPEHDQEAPLISILQAAGLPINEADEAESLLYEIQLHHWQQMMEPVLVMRQQEKPLTIPVKFPADESSRFQWILIQESGAREEGFFRPPELPTSNFFQQGKAHFTCHSLQLSNIVPLGYHQLTIQSADNPQAIPSATAQLIIVPKLCFVPPGLSGSGRTWGISAHLQILRSKSNWGIGDFRDLQQLLVRAATSGVGTVHTGPLNAFLPDAAGPPDPFIPSCRSRLNVLLLDIEAIPDLSESEDLKTLIASAGFQARLTALRNHAHIDYEAIGELKGQLFKKLWDHFSAHHLNPETARGTEFRKFQEEEGIPLRSFAIFSTLCEKFSVNGSTDRGSWPSEFADPFGEPVERFALEYRDEIEYHQYLQWQATLQLAAIGRRSMELGLKVGLLGDFPYNTAEHGFESWYHENLMLPGTRISGRNAADTPIPFMTQNQPCFWPAGLKKSAYRPIIQGLRSVMSQTGGLVIGSIANYHSVRFSFADQDRHGTAVMHFPFAEILGIIALESQRNHCLVIADQCGHLPEEIPVDLKRRQIFSTHTLFHPRVDTESWPDPAGFPENCLVRSSSPFLETMKGFWQARDIAIKTDEDLFDENGKKEKEILNRVADRAHFLISLDHAGLLPDGYPLDPAAVPDLDQSLIIAAQILLARSPAKILLVPINDLLGMAQTPTPMLAGDPTRIPRLADDFEKIMVEQDIKNLFQALCRERGLGVVRPSAPAADRKKRTGLRPPSSFYRLQLHKDFTFLQAAELVPYLQGLGISHCYLSPFLMARPGSSHGYDIINHNILNPELGSREDFETLIAALERHNMALLVDIVPNHMGVGSDNQWWMDVLENGEASSYAGYFDINWQPRQVELSGRILLPVLGDHYGNILEKGRLSLRFHAASGSFDVQYYEHHFPIDPQTYGIILGYDLTRLSDRLGSRHNGYQELQSLTNSFTNLPSRRPDSVEKMEIRRRDKEINKRALARLCREYPEIKQFIDENVFLFNGETDKPESFDALHNLLEKQAYRLAFWRVAAEEINYRRFFDINDLAGLRTEQLEVFQATHQLILDLVATGRVDGLRIDHPDGLYDPYEYFCRLQLAAGDENAAIEDRSSLPKYDINTPLSLFVVVEKILADFEHLPSNWPVCGTTGYDFSNSLNGLFIDADAEQHLTTIYHQFINAHYNFENIVYNSKKLIMRSSMAGELNVLTILLYRLAQSNRVTRDFTLNRLREGLTEVVACFPIYRTYITSSDVHINDLQYIEWAIAEARKQQRLYDDGIVDFIRSVLLVEEKTNSGQVADLLNFILKFQQYTGPVMAKGLEDTAFYIYNRLLSLNEVGGKPNRFGTSPAAFHRNNQDRRRYWPHTMLNTSTHDSKRSEDVRARINVLSEMTSEWSQRLMRWSRLNRSLKNRLENGLAPSQNDEYAFYQNLLGAWPLEPLDEKNSRHFIERMKNVMLKACRESKVHTSWMNPDEEYEKALHYFVERALMNIKGPFLTDFLDFHRHISWFGLLNSLSQVFLKLVSPGIPDIYQGNELWHFCLVDPDNRRPVDYRKRQSILQGLLEKINQADNDTSLGLQQELLSGFRDGRAKMYIILRTLSFRNRYPEVFTEGNYIPLEVVGSKNAHLVAFARKNGNQLVVTAAPRLLVSLLQGNREFPLGDRIWDNTKIILPDGLEPHSLYNIFDDDFHEYNPTSMEISAGALLRTWPVALLSGTTG